MVRIQGSLNRAKIASRNMSWKLKRNIFGGTLLVALIYVQTKQSESLSLSKKQIKTLIEELHDENLAEVDPYPAHAETAVVVDQKQINALIEELHDENLAEVDPYAVDAETEVVVDQYDFTQDENSEAQQNIEAMASWMSSFDEVCSSGNVDSIIEKASELKNNSESSSSKHIVSGLKRCKNVFLDFGANIGDSAGKFIDSGFVGCDLKEQENVVFDVTKREFKAAKANKIVHKFKSIMEALGSDKKPYDYCVYPVEGNPVFTERLKAIEDTVMNFSPRPVRNIHFLTEHVGAGEDGPTELFLDTVNEDHNFWGSSILKSHQDVKKSVNEGEEPSSHPVEGITLSTLVKKSSVAFSPDASEEDKKGGHLIVKIDIEGGEYDLMEEVANSGVLCDYKAMGNTVDLVVEYHRMSITDPKVRNPLLAKKGKAENKLRECGVEIQGMSAMWS